MKHLPANFALLGAAAALLLLAFDATAFDDYSGTTPGCKTCHLEFSPSLHGPHTNVLNGDCNTCHTDVLEPPVYIGRSTGGAGLAPISCAGCHGRAQDGTGTGSLGYGAGLRQRHWRVYRYMYGTSTRVCRNCHGDSDPGVKTTVPESVPPPYYADPGTDHPAIPSDSCNRAPSYSENFMFNTRGLDNDGDSMFDELDPDCAGATPGEASGLGLSPLDVTAYDPAAGEITISYGPACAATGHHIEMGPLTHAALSTYGWSSRICGIGGSGAARFNPGPGSWFFVVVADNGVWEGSYGTDSAGVERSEDTGSAGCAEVPQNLANRCD